MLFFDCDVRLVRPERIGTLTAQASPTLTNRIAKTLPYMKAHMHRQAQTQKPITIKQKQVMDLFPSDGRKNA